MNATLIVVMILRDAANIGSKSSEHMFKGEGQNAL